MAVFSTNQVRHAYVVKAVKGSFAELTDPGDAFVNSSAGEMFLSYINALGSKVASDRIPFKGIESVRATSSDEIAHKIHGFKVCLDADVNDGNPVPGQDYMLTANIYEFKGMSAENEGQKYGVARPRARWTASDLYKALAVNFAMGNDCEPVPFLKVTLLIGGEEVEVHGYDKPSDIEGDAEAIYIWEKEQRWIRGLMSQQTVDFEVTAKPIYFDGFHQPWCVAEKVTSDDTLPEGQVICDLEWFAMGERGDQYRGMGYPNVIPTKYLAEPDKLYDVLNIHYNFTDSGENSYKSEKAMQLICLNDGSHTVINALINAINALKGSDISPLSLMKNAAADDGKQKG